MQSFLIFIVPLTVIFCSVSFFALLLKKKFCVILPLYLMSVAIVEYIFMFFGQMIPGIIAIATTSLGLPVLIVYRKLRYKTSFKQQSKKVFSPSARVFLILYVILFILNITREFLAWDEFMHWGLFVKETLRLRDFYNASGTIIQIHADYPPIITVYESIWCVLTGGYSEPVLYLTLQLLGFSFMLPFIAKLKWGKSRTFYARLLQLICILLIIPCIVALEDCKFYSTIYVDSIIAYEFAFGLSLVYLTKKFNRSFFVRFCILLAFMLLTKQACILFAGLLCAYVLVRSLTISPGSIKHRVFRTAIIAVILLSVTAAAYIPWSMRVKATGSDMNAQFDIVEILSSLKDLFEPQTAYESNTNNLIVGNFFSALTASKPIFLNFSYLALTILVPVFVFLLFRDILGEQDVKRYITLIAFIIVSSILYVLMMLALYLVAFDTHEGIKLASFERYMGTFWLAIFVALFCIVISKRLPDFFASSSTGGHVLIILMLACVPADAILEFIPQPYSLVDFSSDFALIRENTEEYARIYTIEQHPIDPYSYVQLQYHTYPRQFNNPYKIGSTGSIGIPYDPVKDYCTFDITAEEWLRILTEGKYDYVYLYKIDDEFVERLGHLFSYDNLESGQLYKVEDKRLIYVGERS